MIENPKTKGSGILCAIPQRGTCPLKCSDCFFQSGRSYLEPLDRNLPNLPSSEEATGRVVRMNDGNDSNNERSLVIRAAAQYNDVFFNTAIPKDLGSFPGPVVLTANPGKMTDGAVYLLPNPPPNLMFVRARVNSWNLHVVDEVVAHYTSKGFPVVLTFLAYYGTEIPAEEFGKYEFKRRTLNSYWCLRDRYWDIVVDWYRDNPLVSTCGRDSHTYSCARCGVCLREYFATKGRIRNA